MIILILVMILLMGLLVMGAVILFRHALKSDDTKYISISNISQARKIYNHTESLMKSIIYVDMKFDNMNDVHSKGEIQRAVDFCNINLLNTVKKGLGEVVALIEDSSYIVVGKASADEFVSLCEYFYDEMSKYIVQNKLYEAPVIKFGMYTPRDSAVRFEEAVVNAKQTYRYAVANNKEYAICDNEKLYKFEETKQLEQYIVNAIDKNEFHIMMQPYVETKTQRIVGCEVLARLKHPICGLVMPDVFLEVITRRKLNIQFDFCIFEKCCQWISSRRKEELEGKIVSCNFSRKTISHGDFANRVIELIEKYRVPVEHLAIEFTESEKETNKESVVKNLNVLKERGVSVYLDDYGSGVTSYDDLLNYSVSLIKIDRDILYSTNTESGKAVFENIVSMAQKLNVPLLCEGAKTAEQVEFLKKSDVKYIQGFYFYMPMESYECSTLFKEHTK